MSPEQIEGKSIDARSDVFSLGILLCEMATGTRPFDGDSAVGVMSSILKDTPPTLTELRAESPEALSRLVARCFEKRAGEENLAVRRRSYNSPLVATHGSVAKGSSPELPAIR